MNFGSHCMKYFNAISICYGHNLRLQHIFMAAITSDGDNKYCTVVLFIKVAFYKKIVENLN